MLEIKGRHWLAKSALWHFGGATTALPNVAYFASAAVKPPEFAEATCGPGGALSHSGSTLSPDGLYDGVLPPFSPMPLTREEGAAIDVKGDICLLQGKDWPDAPLPGAELYVLVNAAELWRRPRELAKRLARFSDLAPCESALYAPGCATPANIALLIYCGIGLVDDTLAHAAAASGISMGHEGGLPSEESVEELLAHNRRELHAELRKSLRYMRMGRLREYAEYKAGADPLSCALLRYMDLRHYASVEAHVPLEGPSFRANTKASLTRPDVMRWHERILKRYRPPEGAKVLLLIPCSARKPYSLSRTHALFRSAIERSGAGGVVHEVIVTSPLGAVPRELESFYPARQYDIPVTGDWDREERHRALTLVEHIIKGGNYSKIVMHLDAEAEFLGPIKADASTGGVEATSAKSLDALAAALREAAKGLGRVPARQREAAGLASLARFQFGEAGDALMQGCSTRMGRGHVQILKGGEQVASYREERGMLSLAPAGGKALSESGAYCVKIDDFEPKGTVFVGGVMDADKAIRAGDDVAVIFGDDVRAVGVARMSGPEMLRCKKGEAVKTRR
jgi:archaeosine synthase